MSVLRIVAVLGSLAAYAPSVASDFDPWTDTARYALEYRVELGALVSAEGQSARVWLPMPADNAEQDVLATEIDSPWPYQQTHDELNNCYLYLEPRASRERVEPERVVVMRFEVQRKPFRGVKPAEAKAGTPLDPKRYLGAQRRIPLGGELRRLAEQAGQAAQNDGEEIRAFYDHVLHTMRYSKHGEGWGRGDALWACQSNYGNCTDFHSVFIGMARSVGIPARFVIGFPIPADQSEGTVSGYHCWAEAYDGRRGWVPVDASEAWKRKRFDDYFGRLPSDRVEFTVGRDLVLQPPQAGEPLNYFVYPYAEIGGKPAESVPWSLHFRRQDSPPDSESP